MPVQEAVWWALVGSGLIEASDLYSAIHASRGFPWKRRGHLELRPYLVSVLIRLTVGTGLTAALAATSQVATATSAFAVGVAAPKILEQIARRVPQSLAVGEERRDFGTHADQAVGLTSDPLWERCLRARSSRGRCPNRRLHRRTSLCRSRTTSHCRSRTTSHCRSREASH